MGNEVICKKCGSIMANKGKIEDPETGTEAKYKNMYYCEHCNSYKFITIGMVNKINTADTKINDNNISNNTTTDDINVTNNKKTNIFLNIMDLFSRNNFHII